MIPKATLAVGEAEVGDTEEKAEEEAEKAKEEEKEKAEKAKEDPEELLCPILQSLMTDPVITEDGFTYERSAIEHWLKDHDTSPKTGKEASKQEHDPKSHSTCPASDLQRKSWSASR